MNGKIQTRPNFNFSVVSTAKHSLDSKIPHISSGVGLTNIAMTSAPVKPLLDLQHGTTGHPDISTRRQTLTYDKINIQDQDSSDYGVYQTLASLALICILSLFMAFLALFFLQKIGPLTLTCGKPFTSESPKKLIIGSEEFLDVYQVSISLSTLTIAFNLCCLFVCSIQFLFAIKLMKTPQGDERTNKFLKRTSYTRIIAMGGFFMSIPIFFTGVILFTFIHFHEVPAIITSLAVGLGIIFCGVVSVQNVYLWQWEKTQASRERVESRLSQLGHSRREAPDVTAHSTELSTLV